MHRTATILPFLYIKVKQSRHCSGPDGSRKLRFPDFMTTAQDGGKVVSLTHRSPLPPGKAPGTHFFLEAESKDFMPKKNSSDTCWDRTSDLPICNTAP